MFATLRARSSPSATRSCSSRIISAARSDDRFTRWSFHPFRCQVRASLPDELAHLRPVAEALGLLQQLHRQRNYGRAGRIDTHHRGGAARRRSSARTARGDACARRIRAPPGGEQALANVLHVAELARQYKISGGMSFRGFVEELRDEAEPRAGAEAPMLEEGSDGVRMMTVHKAKGLEFPVVILADMTAKLAAPGRTLDQSERQPVRAEARRLGADDVLQGAERPTRRAPKVALAYVAATRARDFLVVPASATRCRRADGTTLLMPARLSAPIAGTRGAARLSDVRCSRRRIP